MIDDGVIAKRYGAVFSGGGSFGAYYAGTLYNARKKYDVLVGSSTGSLLALMTAVQNWEGLKDGYTNSDNNRIYSVNPFNKEGNVKVLKALFRVIRGKYIGEIGNLEKLIRQYFTEDHYNQLKSGIGPELIVIVTNASYDSDNTEYINLKNTDSYDQFVKYTLASCSMPVITEPVDIKGDQFIDGGVGERTPLKYLKQYNLAGVDCFISEKSGRKRKGRLKNAFNAAGRTWNIIRTSMMEDEEMIGQLSLEDVDNPIKIRFYYLPEDVQGNWAVFNKEKMRMWFEMGTKLSIS